MGAVPDWVTRFAPCPWVVRAVMRVVTKPSSYAPPGLWDLVTLVVSQDNSCRYCYGVQRSLLKIFGYDDTMLARLERDFHLAGLAETDRAALDFARKLSRAYPRPGRREYDDLARAGFERAAIAEIAFAVAATAFTNRTATLVALPPDAQLESMVTWTLFRFLRPLVAWRMRRARQSPQPLAAADDRFGARVVAALGDSPSATILRRTIDDAWDSDILPRRTKALMFAVIAKALGCAYCEDEAHRALFTAGLDEATIDDVLANLGSSRLDRREQMLVPFARETVRYQPADIQRRMREVTVGMRPAEIVELAGVVSLANAVSRLSVLLDVC